MRPCRAEAFPGFQTTSKRFPENSASSHGPDLLQVLAEDRAGVDIGVSPRCYLTQPSSLLATQGVVRMYESVCGTNSQGHDGHRDREFALLITFAQNEALLGRQGGLYMHTGPCVVQSPNPAI